MATAPRTGSASSISVAPTAGSRRTATASASGVVTEHGPSESAVLNALVGLLYFGAVAYLIAVPLTSLHSPRLTIAAGLAIIFVGLRVCSRAGGASSISATRVYLLVYLLFNYGLAWTVLAGITPQLFNKQDQKWFTSPHFEGAVYLIAVFSAVLIAVVRLAHGLSRAQRSGLEPAPRPVVAIPGVTVHAGPVAPEPVGAGPLVPGEQRNTGVGRLGMWTVAVAVVVWFGIFLATGLSLFARGSYGTFLESTEGGILPYIYLAIAIGLVAVAADARGTTHGVGVAFFLLFALIAFPVGLRGEVLLPAAAYVVVRSRWYRTGLYRWVPALTIVFLALGSIVRLTRVATDNQVATGESSVGILDGLYELGYTIRPVIAVLGYARDLGEVSVGSGTYTNPILRIIDIFGLTGRPSASDDPTAFNTLMRTREGPIGGNPVAEAFRAGDVTGVILLAIVLGIVLWWLDSAHSTPLADTAVGGILFILVLWVRNTFIPVPYQVAVLVLFLAVAGFLTAAARRADAERIAAAARGADASDAAEAGATTGERTRR